MVEDAAPTVAAATVVVWVVVAVLLVLAFALPFTFTGFVSTAEFAVVFEGWEAETEGEKEEGLVERSAGSTASMVALACTICNLVRFASAHGGGDGRCPMERALRLGEDGREEPMHPTTVGVWTHLLYFHWLV